MMSGYSSGSGETRLEIMTPSMLSQEQLHRLLDLVPGLEYCTLDRRSGMYVYSQTSFSRCQGISSHDNEYIIFGMFWL